MDQSSTIGRSTMSSQQSSRRHDSDEDEASDASSQQSEDTVHPRWLLCWYLLSWCFAILTYIAEGFVVVWAAIHYLTFDLDLNLSLTVTCYFVASFVNGCISLFWYYDLDRVYLKQLRASGPFPGTYKRKCSFAAIVSHCLLLGEVYRYGELIVRLIFSGQTSSLNVLRRDATLLRFFHGFIITAPQIIIHLYTITVATDSTHPDHDSYPVSMRVLLPVVGMCAVSLLYSLATYVTSDRLNSKTRRVILPAHLSLMGWYVCIVASRIIALTLFAHAFGYFVTVFLFSHWLLSVLGILNQKGQFCVDYGQQPKKQRWWLEVPFSLYAACLYQFVFFSLTEGTTKYAVSVYLVVTMIENVLMVTLFYTEYSLLWYAPAAIAVVVGLYLLGALLLVVYYLVLHPDRTKDWYWIGFPKKCCQFLGKKSKSYRPHRVEISQPTLVNMNGEATNLQSRMSGFQPLPSILTRNKNTGQMQLTVPPQVIDSGLTSQDNDYYKKPRIHVPQQSLELSSRRPPSQQNTQYQIPNSSRTLPGSHTPNHTFPGSHVRNHTLPIGHTQSVGSNFSSEPASANDQIRILTIPTTASLGSSMRTDSDDLEIPEPGVPGLVPASEQYIPAPSQHSMGLHMNTQIESAFHAMSLNVPNPNPNLRNDVTVTNNNFPHDIDIDSPLVSPYDTLDAARKDAITIQETETILEENDIIDGADGRLSASPPNLPTPDFTDENLLPGPPSPTGGDLLQLQGLAVGDAQSHDHKSIPVPPPPPMSPQQIFTTNSPPNNNQPSTTPTTQNSTITTTAVQSQQPQQSSASQLQMFQRIPAKRDYHTQHSTLEQHYFPEPASHSTPNLPAVARGSKIGTGVQSSANNSSGGAIDSRHRSLPPNGNSVPASQGLPEPTKNVPPLLPEMQTPSRVNPSNYSPNGHGRQRGGRGGGKNRNPQQQQKSQQSYYAYDNPAKQPPRPSPGRPHSFHMPQVSAENRQRLFGRTLPGEVIAHGNHVSQSPWQQQRSTMPGHVVVPPPPVQKPPDRSRTMVPFQTNDHVPIRPRSYSEGTTLESSPAQERRNNNPTRHPNHKNMAPPHYLGRSPGAPRRDQHQNYHTPTDRTQVLNLTWTSPRLHHDPAISGQSPSQRHKMMSYEGVVRGPVPRQPPHPPILKDRSQTAYELRGSYGHHVPMMNDGRGNTNFNTPHNISNPSQLGGGAMSHLHGNRRQSTNQNPLLHIPAQSSHTSCV